ncbi:MAG: oxaloacetate decarboxylase [Ruminococcus sp.]|nr:oxaloacetate decarboxylase [Ruminococcus sp.]
MKKNKTADILLMIAGIVFAAAGIIILLLFRDRADTIGIIGGADGPTAVFVTGAGGWKAFVSIAAGVILAGAGIFGITNKKS